MEKSLCKKAHKRQGQQEVDRTCCREIIGLIVIVCIPEVSTSRIPSSRNDWECTVGSDGNSSVIPHFGTFAKRDFPYLVVALIY